MSMILCMTTAAVCLAAPSAVPPPPPAVGSAVFETDFSTQASRDAWSSLPCADWVDLPGRGVCLKVEVAEDAPGQGTMITMPLDLSRYGDCRLFFRCLAKAEDVTEPEHSYLGVKYMLHAVSPTSGDVWVNENNVHGTFDWKELSFTVMVPSDVESAVLQLGLQGSTGTVFFDDLRVTVASRMPTRPAPDPNAPPAFRGHSLARLRGCMSPNTFRDEDLRVLGQDWNANLIRWQMTTNWGADYQHEQDYNLKRYHEWLDAELDDLERALDACRRYGILAVIDLHSPPGGRRPNRDLVLIHEPRYLAAFVACWEKIARRFAGHPAVWAYDLVNEPVQNRPPDENGTDYLQAQVLAARAIRAIDPETAVIIEVDQWDSADGFRYLEPVDVPRVVYQVHMYWPHSFTHQGVHGSPVGVEYPGDAGHGFVDKDALRRHLAPVREFQLAYGAHIYVGEFSAIRWAPDNGAYRYLRDCVEVFEEYGWDWSYHAFREWDGWSLEHGTDPDDRTPNSTPGKRLQFMLDWFGRNEKPVFE
jgi:hypothetical protein